jgi:hypothetical protein
MLLNTVNGKVYYTLKYIFLRPNLTVLQKIINIIETQ